MNDEGNKNSVSHYNDNYWAFIHLITMYPYRYLNSYGRVLYKIVDDGTCKSISQLARYLGVDRSLMSKKCRFMESEGGIIIIKRGNRKEIHFSDDVLDDAQKITRMILQEQYGRK